jgi:DNA/RNA endonuclease G (NUC1)
MAIKKTSKVKGISKPIKTSKTGGTVKSKKLTTSKYIPNEEEIRKKANEIYLQRINRGEHGTALDDWHKAEELLRGSEI